METNKSLYRIGKDDYKAFMNIRFSKKSNFVSFFFGILFAAIIIFPFACVIFELVELYWFTRKSLVIFLTLAWLLLMIANGLSNYITIKMMKAYNNEMKDLMQLDDKAIWFYQTLNPGFGITMLAIMIIFWMAV